MVSRKILIFVAALFVISLSYFVVSDQATGEFDVGNSAPTISGFEVQDGASSWDSAQFTTHDSSPNFRWIVNDLNPDVLTTSVCIGTAYDTCDLDSSQVGSFSSGQQATYTFPSALTLTLSDCAGSFCAKTFYARVNVSDGQSNSTQHFTFNITNSIPDTPTSLSPLTTHSQNPTFTWTATDPDDGTVDKWPADSLVSALFVGTSFGDSAYENNLNANSAGEVVDGQIPWGVPGVSAATNTVYSRVYSTDSFGFNSSYYDQTFDLVDNLPEFVNVFISDSAPTSSESCVDFLPQNCFINPLGGNYTSVNVRLTVNDSDGDCSALTHSASAVLCLVDAGSSDVCNATTNANYSYSLAFEGASADSCNFTVSVPSGSPSGIEFFRLPGTYKLFLEASSQSGSSTTPWNYVWEYTGLQSTKYTNFVFLGDRVADGGNGIQLNSWNPGLYVSKMTNQGNTLLNLNWTATDPSSDGSICSGNTATCWDLSTNPDLQIDDDASQSDDTGNLMSVSFSESPLTIQFNPAGGLQICNSIACNSGINESMNTTFHIMPPLGLGAGTYQTNITYIPIII